MNIFGAFPEWFGVFYALAFLTGYLVAAVVGYRRGWPLAAWLLVLAAAGLGGVVGTRLLPLGVEGLQSLLATGVLPETTIKRIPGTVAGALAMAAGARWLLGLRHSVLDPFAYAGLASLAVARIGCLLAGCCFGTPTDLPWGVTYAQGSFTHGFHFAHGIIEAGAAPHPVHPIPLYDIGFALVGLALLPHIAKPLRAPGSLCWATVGGYAVYRFAQDFVRANELASLGGLTRIQWACLAAAALALTWVVVRERRVHRQLDATAQIEPAASAARLGLAFSGLLVLCGLLAGWLTPLEELILMVRLVPAGLALAVVVWTQHVPAPLRGSMALAAAGLPIVLGFQLAPPDSSQGRLTFWAVDAHAATGRYEELDICSPDLYNYQTAGGAIAFVTAAPSRDFSRELGLRAYVGSQSPAEEAEPSGTPPARSTRAVAPYLRLDGKWVGGHVGAHIGEVPLLGPGLEDDPGILPSFGVRLGPRDAHIHWGVLDGPPFGSPAPAFRFGVGTGRLTADGHETRVQAGLADGGVYALASVPIGQVVIEPMVMFGAREQHHVGLRARVQFGRREVSSSIPPPSPASLPVLWGEGTASTPLLWGHTSTVVPDSL